MSTTASDTAAIEAVLNDFLDPETGRSVRQMDQIQGLALEDGCLSLTLALTTHSAPLWEETRAELVDLFKKRCPDLKKIEIHLAEHARPPEKSAKLGSRPRA